MQAGLGVWDSAWGPLCEERELAVGPFPLVKGSFSGLLISRFFRAILKHVSDHHPFREFPQKMVPMGSPNS